MSKFQNVIVGVLLFCLTGAVSYLGLQYAALQTAWEQSLQNRTAFQENSAEWSQDLSNLKESVATQQAEIDNIKNQWQSDLAKLETDLETNYLTKQPQFAVNQAIFNYNESALTTEANVQALAKWLADNRFYLAEILDKSLTLTYDGTGRGAIVDKVVPDSIFAQMGLKPGDRLVSFNGQPVTRAIDIKQKLLEPQNSKVVIARANQNLNLAFSYVASEKAVNNSIKVAETNYQNQKAVKVIELDTTVPNVLKANDVILSVNGQMIPSSETFYEAIKTSEANSMSFAIVRDGQNQELDVALSNAGN